MPSCNIEPLPFCCGVDEAGNFNDVDEHYGHAIYKDSEEELLKEILRYCEGKPVIFNFVKRRNWQGLFDDEYEASLLRTLVRTHPKATHLHKGINPGSQNHVDTYMISNYKIEEEKDGEA